MTSGQSGHLKGKFIAAFCELGNVKAACKRAGITRRGTIYEWRDSDPDFAAAWAEAEVVATETLEAEAWRRAVKGVRSEHKRYFMGAEIGTEVKVEYSDTLLIFLLKARSPEKYRERSDVTLKATVEDASGLTDEQRAERLASIFERARARAGGPAEPGAPGVDTDGGSAD